LPPALAAVGGFTAPLGFINRSDVGPGRALVDHHQAVALDMLPTIMALDMLPTIMVTQELLLYIFVM
jgi:hypothetical protein